MNDFFHSMKLIRSIVAFNCRNCVLNKSPRNVSISSGKVYNECLMGSPLRIFNYMCNRNFTIYASFYSDKGNTSDAWESKTSNNRMKRTPKISLIDERDKETVMDLASAEKLAKRKNMKLVITEHSKEGKVKYKLEKKINESDEQKKNRDKRVFMRVEIESHDIGIKINQMLKLLNKGEGVTCLIEGSAKKEKLERVVQTLEESKLKDYFLAKQTTRNAVKLKYAPTGNKVQPQEEKKENVQQSN